MAKTRGCGLSLLMIGIGGIITPIVYSVACDSYNILNDTCTSTTYISRCSQYITKIFHKAIPIALKHGLSCHFRSPSIFSLWNVVTSWPNEVTQVVDIYS